MLLPPTTSASGRLYRGFIFPVSMARCLKGYENAEVLVGRSHKVPFGTLLDLKRQSALFPQQINSRDVEYRLSPNLLQTRVLLSIIISDMKRG